MAVEAFAKLELLIDTAVDNAWRDEPNRRHASRNEMPRMFGAKLSFLGEVIANAELPSVLKGHAVDAVHQTKELGKRRNDLVHSVATGADPQDGPMQRIMWDRRRQAFARQDFGYTQFDTFTGDVLAATERSVGYILAAVNAASLRQPDSNT